jgi:hypothetical protein
MSVSKTSPTGLGRRSSPSSLVDSATEAAAAARTAIDSAGTIRLCSPPALGSSFETPTKVSTEVAAREAKKSLRSSSFSELEDYIICKAYTYASLDSRRGTSQKRDDFQSRIHQAWLKVITSEGHSVSPRTSSSLFQRFKKYIQPAVTNFQAILRNINRQKPSGASEEDISRTAENEYKARYKQSFKFQRCLRVLHESPKFDHHFSNLLEDDTDEGVQSDRLLTDSYHFV